MPTYAYRGKVCDHEFEVRQSFSDDPVTDCQVCGQPVYRVIHPAGIVFKGTGWYLTDSRPTQESAGGVQDASKASEKKPEPKDSPTPAAKESSPAAKPAAAPAAAD